MFILNSVLGYMKTANTVTRQRNFLTGMSWKWRLR